MRALFYVGLIGFTVGVIGLMSGCATKSYCMRDFNEGILAVGDECIDAMFDLGNQLRSCRGEKLMTEADKIIMKMELRSVTK